MADGAALSSTIIDGTGRKKSEPANGWPNKFHPNYQIVIFDRVREWTLSTTGKMELPSFYAPRRVPDLCRPCPVDRHHDVNGVNASSARTSVIDLT